MNYKTYKYLVLSDLYRSTGRLSTGKLFFQLLFGAYFKYNFWMRTCAFSKSNSLLNITLFPVSFILLRHYRYKYGISIPHSTNIGSGFYISHFGDIVVNARAQIGKNCNISQGVTFGQANRGKKKGYPILGDNVYIGPGAKIIGAIKIGNNVAIGANCVVTNDIPNDAVVVGIPGVIISYEGTTGYVNRTNYDQYIFRP